VGLIIAEAMRLGLIYPAHHEPQEVRGGGLSHNPGLTNSKRIAYEPAVVNSIVVQ